MTLKRKVLKQLKMKSFPSEIKIGDEFITKSKADAQSSYVLTITDIKKDKKDSLNDEIAYKTTDLKYTKSGSARFYSTFNSAKRWWFNEQCKKIKRVDKSC